MINIIRLQGEKIKRKTIKVFSHEPWWVEFWSAFTAILWAYISQLSGDEIYQHQVFSELAFVAAAGFWQVCAVLVGLIQLSFLIYNDYRIRWVVCFFASWFWTFLTLAIMNSDPHPPGLALYASYSFINLVSMIKLSRSNA